MTGKKGGLWFAIRGPAGRVKLWNVWPSPINKPIIEALSRLLMVRWNRRCPPSGMLLTIETLEKGRYRDFGLIADTQIG